MRITTRLASWAVSLGCLAALNAQAAKADPEQKCRIAIGKRTNGAVGAAALGKAAIGCFGTGKDSAACVQTASIQNQLKAVGFSCQAASCTAELYGVTGIAGGVLQGVEQGVSSGTSTVLASVDLGGDKAKTKCRKAVAKAFSSVVKATVKASITCEVKAKRSCSPLEASCLPGAVNTTKASSQIQKACANLSGSDVGSCDGLPGCLIAAATDAGKQISRAAFGGREVCGNGSIEGDEQCDDGNTVDVDNCRADCRTAVCGDTIVRTGGDNPEECDDGNASDTDACISGTCRAARCGDGFVREGQEQCDDGNTASGDGCSGTCESEAIACGPSGVSVDVVLAVDENASGSGDLAGLRIEVGYGATDAAIPGNGLVENPPDPPSLDPATAERVTPLADPLADDLIAPVDTDATKILAVAIVQTRGEQETPFGSGPVFRVQFDCGPSNALLPTVLTCRVDQASDTLGNAVLGSTCVVVRAVQ
jgi:cysteine-rich repeat protein